MIIKEKLNWMIWICVKVKWLCNLVGLFWGATMKKGRLYMATCLSNHSYYNFFKISGSLSINPILIQLPIDGLIVLEAYWILLPVWCHTEGQSFVYTNAHAGGCWYPGLMAWGPLQPDLHPACGCSYCRLAEFSEGTGFSFPLELYPPYSGEREKEE